MPTRVKAVRYGPSSFSTSNGTRLSHIMYCGQMFFRVLGFQAARGGWGGGVKGAGEAGRARDGGQGCGPGGLGRPRGWVGGWVKGVGEAGRAVGG